MGKRLVYGYECRMCKKRIAVANRAELRGLCDVEEPYSWGRLRVFALPPLVTHRCANEGQFGVMELLGAVEEEADNGNVH